MKDVPPATRERWDQTEMPAIENPAWVAAKPAAQARVAIVSSAGLHLRSDAPFTWGTGDYRAIASDTPASEIVMTHISTNYDRAGYQEDLNVAFPIDRLRELAEAGAVGSVAAHHYSFMGASDPTRMEENVTEVAARMRADGVDSIVLAGV